MSHDHGDDDHGGHDHGGMSSSTSMDMDSDTPFCAGSGRVMLQGFQVMATKGRRGGAAFHLLFFMLAMRSSVSCVGVIHPSRHPQVDGNLSLHEGVM